MANLNPKRYVDRAFGIPFYDAIGQVYKLKLKVPKFNNSTDHRNDVFRRAQRHFLDHFFPEFYPLRIDPVFFEEKLPPTGDIETVEAVSDDVKSAINIDNYFNTSPPSNKTIMVFETSYDFIGTRTSLEEDGKMPSYEESLAFFREEKNMSSPTSETTLVIASLGTSNNAFNDGMSAYNRQMQGFEGQLNINVDFGFLKTDVQKFLNALVADLVSTLSLKTGTTSVFTDADTITLQFGTRDRKAAIVGIEYLLVEESISSEPAKVGTFTGILYNRIFKDPLSIATLRNYENIVESVQNGAMQQGVLEGFLSTSWQGSNPNGFGATSFLDFLESPATLDALQDPPTVLDTNNFDPTFNLGQTTVVGSLNGIQNEFIKVAYEEGLLSPANLEALENGFTEFFKSEEMARIKAHIQKNPALYRRVFENTKAKTLNKARGALDIVNNVLLQGPLGLIDKKNPVVGRLFRSLGVDQLMKEVILCATFGLNYEASRITQAFGNAMQKEISGIYYQVPDLPEPPLYSPPKIDWNLFKPKLKDGNIATIIKTVLVDAVQEMALEIIKSLAELLKENCNFNNPNSRDYGAVDLAERLPSPNTPFTGGETQLDQLAAANNLTTGELRAYIGDLSEILSSVDVCTLFIDRDSISPDLMGKIIEFNQEYDNEFIKTNLSDPSGLMGFFSDLSKLIDVRDICDEIANRAYLLNQDNVCLIFDDADLLDDLINRLQMPEPNLDCPDKANYINDPTISKAVPETFNALVETVEVQYINAADSLKEVLLEPVLVRGSDSNVLSSAQSTKDLGREVQSTGSLESLDPAILNQITTVFETISDAAGNFADAFENCETVGTDPDTGATVTGKLNITDVLGFDPAAANEATAVVIDTLTSAMSDPEFMDAINGINDKLESIAASGLGFGEDGAAPAVTTYRFNQEFYNAFRTYVQTFQGHYNDAAPDYKYTAQVYFESQRMAGSAPTVENAAETATFSNIDTVLSEYVPLHIKFKFPTDLPLPSAPATTRAATIIPDPDEYISIIYPRYGAPKTVRYETSSRSELILDQGLADAFSATDDAYEANFEDIFPPHYTNVYVDRFVQSYIQSPFHQTGTEEEELNYRQDVEAHEFPKAYAALTESIFEYIVNNGVFDAATLQSLNLFHLNNNCPPEEVADFLDVRGILQQMTDEYAEAACGDSTRKVPMRMRIRDVIKYGLYLLLIQLHVADFIIKNIFVFSAFTIDSLLEDRTGYLFKFFRSQVTTSLISYLDSMNVGVAEESTLRLNLAEYFNRKVRRQAVINKGGIRFTAAPNDIAFPVDTNFSATDDSPLIGFDEIIDYLIVERLHLARTPVNNAIKKALPDSRPIELTKAVLTAMPLLTGPQGEDTAPGPSRIRQAARIAFLNTPTVFMLSRRIPTENTSRFTHVYSMWFYDGQDRVTGDTTENAPVLNQFGSGDVVKLLDNLYAETEYDFSWAEGLNLDRSKGDAFEDSLDGEALLGVFGSGDYAERLVGLTGSALRNEIVRIIRERTPMGLPAGNEWSVATVNWLLQGGYESSPREPFAEETQWSILDTPVPNEDDALAILAGVVINAEGTTAAEGTDSLQYQLWRLGILEEIQNDLIPPAPNYDTTLPKNYWYQNVMNLGNVPLLNRLLELVEYELGQIASERTKAWLDAEYHTDNWPQDYGPDTQYPNPYQAAGFPTESRGQAIMNLVHLTIDWEPSLPEDFNGYIRRQWRYMGILSPDDAGVNY